jgi:hypothetical protein
MARRNERRRVEANARALRFAPDTVAAAGGGAMGEATAWGVVAQPEPGGPGR